MKKRYDIDKILKGIEELKESQKKTDEQLKKTDEQLKKTDEQLNRTDAEIDRVIKEAEERSKRIDAEIEKVNKMVGNLTDGWGKFVEGLVEPAVWVLFKRLGYKITRTLQRVSSNVNGRNLEIDILAIGKNKEGEDIILVTEVKSNLTIEEVKKIEGVLREFIEFFPEYRGKKVIGVASGIRFEKGAGGYAEGRGLYVLAPSGENMKILNSSDFKPRIWG
ncbi:MAG: DUF3782 domain-containing protein [Candidatus Hydrogenedentota bacterium]